MLPQNSTYSRLVESLQRYLMTLGLRVEAPAKLVGASGIGHEAAISAVFPDGRKVMIEIFISQDLLNEFPVISTFAKMIDISPSRTFLLMIPGANQLAKRLAEVYGIELIDGESVEDLMTNFEDELPVNVI